MITFITDYDDATEANLSLYNLLDITPSTSLTSVNATKANLASELRANERNVFAMSHGNNSTLFDQNKQPVLAEQDFADFNFTDMNIFSYACNTSNELGEIASRYSCNWLGFAEPINPPESDEELHTIYKSLFEHIYEKFGDVKCEVTAEQFLNELKLTCDQMADEVDTLLDVANNLQPIATHMSIKQLWEKQKIWISDLAEPIMHRAAPSPILW